MPDKPPETIWVNPVAFVSEIHRRQARIETEKTFNDDVQYILASQVAPPAAAPSKPVRCVCDHSAGRKPTGECEVCGSVAVEEWCDDCHGYSHRSDCPALKRKPKPLAEQIVDAVYRSMSQYEDGTWFLDNLKANARVRKLLAAETAEKDAEIERLKEAQGCLHGNCSQCFQERQRSAR